MPFKVQIGPPQISIHHGQTVLITEPDGQINWPSERGLYFLDTRVISSWAIYANGEPWQLLNGGPITYYAARIFLTNHAIATEAGLIPQRTLGCTIGRWIHGGMHEDLDVTNESMKPVKFQLEIAIRCDFADVFEVKSGNIIRRGRIITEWRQARQQLRTTYSNGDFHRSVVISVHRSIYRRERAASLGCRISFHANAGDAGLPAGCTPQQALCRSMLPEWLPDLTIRDLRVGEHKFDIRFWREGKRTEFQVLNGNARLVQRCEAAAKTAELLGRAEPT
ncbi:MAG TPA: glycogen debranching N-terminal domain-containing protein [Methylocella sp.]|nr:glycogen debranching N-terminal domain-containing protein [Methylocella sp.]